MRYRHDHRAQLINNKRVVAVVIGSKLPAASLRKSAKPRQIGGRVNLRQPQPDFPARDVSVRALEMQHITV
jgi:hypothetical protein